MNFAGGGNNTSPATWSVDSMGFANRGGDGGALYFTVDIWPTHFEIQGLQYATVKINGIVVDQYCTPDEECGTDFYTCFHDMDVQSYIQEPLGGVLAFEVSSTGIPHTVCDYMGYPLYARMFLREALPTGQPTVEPSGQPTGQPSTEPTEQPSAEPTGQPSADPSGVPSSEPTGEPTVKPSVIPTGEPTGEPSGEPSGVPSAEPTSNPSREPTSMPSGEPSGSPSVLPTVEPTGEPSGQPTTHPTRDYVQSLSFSGGGDSDNPVVWDVDSLGFVGNSHPLYLSVEVFPTNYENKANQYATVKVNGEVVEAHCTPNESCGSVYYSCVSELDISSYRQEALGGSLSVEVTSTGLNYGVCDEVTSGKPLYARMFLREALPTGEPTNQPSATPSGIPTALPTGEPSAQPSFAPSSEPSSKPSVIPSTEPSASPSSYPSSQPTNIPSAQPSSRPSSEPSTIPTSEPTTAPSLYPSGQPSSLPSTKPSGAPSGQPSSHPTAEFPQSWSYSAGGDNDNPVVWNVDSLGYAGDSHPLYLSVEVFPTNFENMANQYVSIMVEAAIVMAHCTPDESCGSDWFSCVSEMDVSSYVQESMGGSLIVEISSTGLNYGICDHLGKPLYVRLSLRDGLPTSEPSAFPSGSPSGQPTGIPSTIPTSKPSSHPTSQPSVFPSGSPSLIPSTIPSVEPSSQPSSHPTAEFPQSWSYSAGGDNDNPVVWNVDSLGYAGDSHPLYLSVEVFPTNFENMANQYVSIKVEAIVMAHCTPDESCGSDWFSCVSEMDVSSYVQESMGGSLIVEISSTGLNYGICDHLGKPLYVRLSLRDGLPTSEPSTFPSSSPSGQPTGIPSTIPTSKPSSYPTSQPSVFPSGSPSLIPSTIPSVEPSSQPSSHPTAEFPQSWSYSAGGDNDNPVVWNVDSLGYAGDSHPLYLSVEVFPTNFENRGDQFATVKLNGIVIQAYCTPDESCGSDWFSCISEMDVSSYVQEDFGGSLSVEVSSNGVYSGKCDFFSYPLYTRLFLRDALPTGEPTGEPSGGPSGQPTTQPTCVPTGMPSNVPTSQPTSIPSGSPTGQPSEQPSSFPSIVPTGEPTGQPSSEPSAKPSVQPSSHPTLMSPFVETFFAGGNETMPAHFHLTNLGFKDRTERMYLSVAVFPTDFAMVGNQWASVMLNGLVIDEYCSPDESCGKHWFPCVKEMQVSPHIMQANGGSLLVEVSSTGVLPSQCDYRGYPLYVRVDLTEKRPLDEEVVSIYFLLFAAMYLLILFLVGVFCYIIVYKKKEVKSALHALSTFQFSRDVYRDLECATVPIEDSEAPKPPPPTRKKAQSSIHSQPQTGGSRMIMTKVHPFENDDNIDSDGKPAVNSPKKEKVCSHGICCDLNFQLLSISGCRYQFQFFLITLSAF